MLDRLFDFYQILFANAEPGYLLVIIFRTTLMFLFLLFLSRFFGKKSVSEITILELFLFVALSSALGDPMFYQSVGVAWGVTVFLTVLALYLLQIFFSKKSQSFENLIKGKPQLLVKDGSIVPSNLTFNTITTDELLMKLRSQSIESLGEIRRAYMERSGNLSVFKYSQTERKRGLPTITNLVDSKVRLYRGGDTVPESDLYASYSGELAELKKGQSFPSGWWMRAK